MLYSESYNRLFSGDPNRKFSKFIFDLKMSVPCKKNLPYGLFLSVSILIGSHMSTSNSTIWSIILSSRCQEIFFSAGF